MAFEIGPREMQSTADVPRRAPDRYVPEEIPAHTAETHVRVINGARFAFSRRTYVNGAVAIQAIKLGAPRDRKNPDLHYWKSLPS
ncbi:hypothetical protein [Streptomyces olivaceus]|uniref:hypothetical protein n=1 Tax=Streptomyces olivaceus TaxID=47716 RepID=UPI0036E7EF37